MLAFAFPLLYKVLVSRIQFPPFIPQGWFHAGNKEQHKLKHMKDAARLRHCLLGAITGIMYRHLPTYTHTHTY